MLMQIIYRMWLSDFGNHLAIGSLVEKIQYAEKRPGGVGRVAQSENILIFNENSLGLRPSL